MKKSLLDHVLDWTGRIVLTAIVGFVLLPFVVVAIASLNESAILSFPPDSLSLRWYANAFEYRDFAEGLVNSLKIAAVGALVALIAGAGFAYVLDRYDFALKGLLNGVLMSPLIIPNFTIGLGLLILSAAAALPRTMWLVVALEDRCLDMKALAGVIGAARLSFARPARLGADLGIAPGAVTPFALINHRGRADHGVRVILDAEMMRAPLVNYHPLVNTATTAVTPADLLRFIADCGHRPKIVDLAPATAAGA